MSLYVVAVKRDQRVRADKDWFKPALSIEKVKVLSPTNKYRIVVECDDDTIVRLRSALSSLCHIEKQADYQPRKI